MFYQPLFGLTACCDSQFCCDFSFLFHCIAMYLCGCATYCHIIIIIITIRKSIKSAYIYYIFTFDFAFWHSISAQLRAHPSISFYVNETNHVRFVIPDKTHDTSIHYSRSFCVRKICLDGINSVANKKYNSKQTEYVKRFALNVDIN